MKNAIVCQDRKLYRKFIASQNLNHSDCIHINSKDLWNKVGNLANNIFFLDIENDIGQEIVEELNKKE